MTDASVNLWGKTIGAVSWLENKEIAVFQYTADFAASSIEVSPFTMPLGETPFTFPELPRASFHGLPGMLADSLPDNYGNVLIDSWLAQQGLPAHSFNPVQRLCYVGTRGMGALEFQPAAVGPNKQSRRIEVDALAALANQILDERINARAHFSNADERRLMEDILHVGTSAGGARAKAVVAWNAATGEFRSGQVPVDEGFSHWILKFDGIADNRDKELADPADFGRIEYAYSLMATEAGINMMPCRLFEQSQYAHFMTRRFDRTERGNKLHMQSLAALMHFDFNQPDAYSYEQAFLVVRELGLPRQDLEQQYRRAIFNIIARNQDDHVKNIAFLMDQSGEWRLSPAFDVAYSYNPQGAWTGRHQMSANGRRDEFATQDLLDLAKSAGIRTPQTKRIILEVADSIANWSRHARDAGIPERRSNQIERTFRIQLAAASHRK